MEFSSLKLSSFLGPYFYLFLSFILNVFPWGNSFWVPDFLLAMLVFWILYSPEKVNFLSAFLLGLLMDVQTSQFLGIHAFVYVFVCFFIIYYQRKLLNATFFGQSMMLLGIFILSQCVLFSLLWIMGTGTKFTVSYLFIPSLIDTLLLMIFKRYIMTRNLFLYNNQT
jgi:rod shape-determining protein MreD